MSDMFHREITDHLKVQDTTLEKILTQTSKTNGRVSFLEKIYYGLTMCGGIVIIIVIPLLVYIYVNGQNRIQSEIAVLQNVKDNLSVQLSK